MSGLLLFLLAVVCVFLAWRLHRIRSILRDFAEAVSQKTSYLQEAPSRTIKTYRIDQLIQIYSELLQQERRAKDLEYEMHNQIEAVLGKIQEAVCTIDQHNTIIHSNNAACETFNQGKPIRGKRIEEIIRNPEFLDCAHLAKNGQPQNNREVSINIQNKDQWFEVSATPISKATTSTYGSVLFVFHNISRLKDLEIVKNNFVANVSHELKTPITIIKGFTETLLEDDAIIEPSTRQKFLSKIEMNTERLNLIVQDLLTLSRIESEPEFLQKTRTDMSSLLEGIEENYRNMIKPSQSLLLDNRAEGAFIDMDGFKVTQVFQNLLDNAIRYSGDSSEITFFAQFNPDSPYLRCGVIDNGPGIPESDIPNIFRRFYRVDKARSRVSGGTGLGLSIARGIIELHGGSIAARNRPEGGLEISFTIPND
jgi:two-component system phosphate regulon sensor histidine kinase PhoR